MDDVAKIIAYSTAAGACIPAGAFIAKIEHITPRWLESELRHFIIAFGGGILLAAVALLLVPEGNEYVKNAYASVMFFVLGGGVFFYLERYMGKHGTDKPQFMAMLLDYIPETLAMGGALALGAASAPLLALFIGIQNIPEGFNAYRELRSDNKLSSKRILSYMMLLVLLGPVVGLIGWAFFSKNAYLLGAVMLFASGGILYLIFQDIAPQAHRRHHWTPSLGAVAGFSMGLLGHNLIG